MELNSSKKKTSSQDLLSFGNGGAGFHEALLVKPQPGKTLQTERVPRSSVLDRLHSFLPQMAQANEKLKQQMSEAPDGHFDIECVEEADKVIEMDVAVVELSDSDSDTEEHTSQEETSDSEEETGVTEENLRLPGDKNKKKANIQVVDKQEH